MKWGVGMGMNDVRKMMEDVIMGSVLVIIQGSVSRHPAAFSPFPM